MSIWKRPYSVEILNSRQTGTIGEQIGLEITQVGGDFLRGRIPVDHRTKQPVGLLHGGASVVLAETLGSLAAMMCLEEGKQGVGLEINANHIRAARSGFVTGTARAIHIGSRTHVWSIQIVDEQGKVVCISRLTMAIVAGDSIAK